MLGESPGEITEILEPRTVGDGRDFLIGPKKLTGGLFQTELLEILGKAGARELTEEFHKMAGGEAAEGRGLLHGDFLHVVGLDMGQGLFQLVVGGLNCVLGAAGGTAAAASGITSANPGSSKHETSNKATTLIR